jgi:REP element-mobilizing transposase RayT
MTEGLHRFYGGNDLHFLTFSCYRRRPLFRNEAHCDLFLKILNRVRRRYRPVVLGYVVMPEHIHLLVSEPQRETLSTAIQALKLGFVRSMKSGTFGGVPTSRKRSREVGHPHSSFRPESILAVFLCDLCGLSLRSQRLKAFSRVGKS